MEIKSSPRNILYSTLSSAIFCLCLCCSSSKEQSEFKGSLADMEEYDEHAGDNVL